MLRSMFSGVSGLRSHQTMMDVIGNNIANVNTTGFKSSQIVFEDLLSQVVRGAGVPVGANGGSNPAAVGLGVKVAGINTSFTQGASQLTGRSTDLAIQGDGFFVVKQNGQRLFTRNGALEFDATGRMVSVDGGVIQGWQSDTTGVIDANAPVTDLVMAPGQLIPPTQTKNVRLGGNLPATVTGSPTTSIDVYDSLGTAHSVPFTFAQTAPGVWTLSAPGLTSAVTFDAAGNRTSPQTIAWTPTIPGWAGDPVTIDLGTAGAPHALTQFSGEASLAALSQDGSAAGSLQSFAISADGLVTGVFSNGQNRALARIALASFNNPGGLEKAGSSTYRDGVNSGLAQIGAAGDGGRGIMSSGTLEMSNVDLAAEFTNLIIAQRGFQANSRVITASDELLQDLVNLKR